MPFWIVAIVSTVVVFAIWLLSRVISVGTEITGTMARQTTRIRARLELAYLTLRAMASHASSGRYRFEAFELQLDEREGYDVAVALRPRTFDLLVALVDQAGHLVTKEQLLDRVWPKVVVEEAALHLQVSALRKILSADAIATVSGQGYRFMLPVTKVIARATRTVVDCISWDRTTSRLEFATIFRAARTKVLG